MVQSQTQCKIVNRISEPAPGPSSFMVQVKMQGQSEGERLAKVLCLGDCWQMSLGPLPTIKHCYRPSAHAQIKHPQEAFPFTVRIFPFFFFLLCFTKHNFILDLPEEMISGQKQKLKITVSFSIVYAVRKMKY